MLIPKEKRKRDSKHLAFIRTLPCVSCLSAPQNQAAHVRMGSLAGVGQKPDDSRTVPLCDKCHAEQHNRGEESFWVAQGMDPVSLADAIYKASGDKTLATRIICSARVRRS